MAKAFIGGYGTGGIGRVEIGGDGSITLLGVTKPIDNPIYFAMDKGRHLLYVAQGAVLGKDRTANGALAVYSIDGDMGLHRLDLLVVGGSVPCHVSLAPDCSRLFHTDYRNAIVGAVALKADGTFGKAVSVRHEGHGPNPVRQEAAHAHCAISSPDGAMLFVCDLGLDTVFAYGLGSAEDGLVHLPDCDFHTEPGAGPRHLVFAPSGRNAYLVNELASTVQSLAFDGRRFAPMQTLPMLPEGFDGDSKAAAIRMSPDGRWVLASNRGHDSIASFAIAADGSISGPAAISRLTGRFPRDFAFVPDTDIVLCCHKLSDELATYRFAPADGSLSRLHDTIRFERPLAIAFQ